MERLQKLKDLDDENEDKIIFFLLIRKLRNWGFKELHSKKPKDKDRRNGKLKI